MSLSSESCETCQDLRRLRTCSETAFRSARNLYLAAVSATGSKDPQNLAEELKQTSTAHKLIRYAVQAQLTNQRSHTGGIRLAA